MNHYPDPDDVKSVKELRTMLADKRSTSTRREPMITTETNTNPSLTADDVAMLREYMAVNTYESMYLSVAAEYVSEGDYKGTIALSRDIKMPGCDPDVVQRRYEMPAKVRIERYDREYTSDHGKARYSAGAAHYHSSDRSALRTLANMVKAGDCVTIHFLIGNNTENLKAAGMKHDECYLAVYRYVGQSGKLKLIGDVYVDDVICPVGSSAGFCW